MPSTTLPCLLLLSAALVIGCSERKSDIAASPEGTAAPSANTEVRQPFDEVTQQEERDAVPTQSAQVYRDVAWEELIPKQDLDALLNPPDHLSAIDEGSPADQAMNQRVNPGSAVPASPYERALTSTRIKPEFDRQHVRIPGFVVPLDFDHQQMIKSFLLVPYFGACIHLPPPPPNQVIYGEFADGFQLQSLYDPFYIEGQMRTLPQTTEHGTAAYTLNVKNVYPYED